MQTGSSLESNSIASIQQPSAAEPHNDGDAENQYQKGLKYESENKQTEALHYFGQAALKNHPHAEYKLAIHYEKKQDLKNMFLYLRKSAARGCTAALTKMGRCYEEGIGINRNENLAFEYTKRAVDNGADEIANWNLGCYYESGLGVEKNMTEAIKYYTVAAKMGFSSAQNKLGLLSEGGVGGAKDLDQAVAYYTLAANSGLAVAQFNLGHCYENGSGVPRNLLKAVEYYSLAVKNGILGAHCFLANIYRKGGEGIEKNLEEAKHHYLLAAEKIPRLRAEYHIVLSKIFENEDDIVNTIKHYALAADKGNINAQLIVAEIYLQQKDIKTAIKYYKLAADCGVVIAQKNLAFLYQKTNRNSASHYFSLATNMGCTTSKLALGLRCFTHHKDREKDGLRMIKQSLALQGTRDYTDTYGFAYTNGLTESQKKYAIKSFTEAALKNDAFSIKIIKFCLKNGIIPAEDAPQDQSLMQPTADLSVKLSPVVTLLASISNNQQDQVISQQIKSSPVTSSSASLFSPKKTPPKALKEFASVHIDAANSGNAPLLNNASKEAAISSDDLFFLGKSYLSGNGREKNTIKGAQLITLASERGNQEAKDFLDNSSNSRCSPCVIL